MNRRSFLRLSSGLLVPGVSGALGSAPAVFTRSLRPEAPSMPGGVQVGDVTPTRAVIWGAADRTSRMCIEVSADDVFSTSDVLDGPIATSETNFTAKYDLGGLTPGEPVFYRVWFEDVDNPSVKSEPVTGQFKAAPTDVRPLTICWSGDVAGQGWGINQAFGGMRLYQTMLRHQPDLFIHSGDQIYADNPLVEEVRLDDGTPWKNLVTPAKQKVAETLDEFRGNFAYNLLDTHARDFNSQVPMIVQWDDHEVLNNWNPGTDLSNRPQYTERNIETLAAHAKQAMFEYLPIRSTSREQRVYRAYPFGPLAEVIVLDQRSYRAANGPNREPKASKATRMLGPTQLRWFKQRLLDSRATWKIVASDMPLGLVVGDGQHDGAPRFEGWANGPGKPLGRELELAELLSFIRQHGIRNVVWVTADVHYAAAHRYDPNAAEFKRFLPFWEFVAGPLHAGTFGAGRTDPTFGCTQVFNSVPPELKPNRPPSEGLQFFGTLSIDPRTRRVTVGLWNLKNEQLWSTVLDAERR